VKETFHKMVAFQWIINWIPRFAASSIHWWLWSAAFRWSCVLGPFTGHCSSRQYV